MTTQEFAPHSDPTATQQQLVMEQLYFLRQQTKEDRDSLSILDELTAEEQIEFAADLTDYLSVHFEKGDFLDVGTRLENLYSSLVLSPNLEVTSQHIDIFAIAAIRAVSSAKDRHVAQELSYEIEAGRRTALKVKNSYYPLPVEIQPVPVKQHSDIAIPHTVNELTSL